MQHTVRIALLVVFSAAVSAGAAPRVKANLSPVFGSNEYNGWNAYLGLGSDNLSLAPEFTTYQFKGSNGRVNNLSVRAGYDMRWFGTGVSAGRTFPINGYSSLFGGADFAFTISPLGDEGVRRIGGTSRGGAPVGKGVARVDFGGGVKAVEHKQDAVVAGAADTKLTQTEIHGFVGASVLGILVSGRLGVYDYNADLRTATRLPNTSATPLVGHMSSVNGFASSSFHANVEIPFFPMVRPFASYTHTRYKPLATFTPGDSKGLAAGVRVGLELVALEAAYQRVVISGAADQNFYTLTAGLRL